MADTGGREGREGPPRAIGKWFRWRARLDARVLALPMWSKIVGAVSFALAALVALVILGVRLAGSEILYGWVTNSLLVMFIVFCVTVVYLLAGLMSPARCPVPPSAVFVIRRLGWSLAALCVLYLAAQISTAMSVISLALLLPALGAAVFAVPNRSGRPAPGKARERT